MKLEHNMGTADRAIRLVVGLALILAAITGALGVWAWIGVVPVVTAAIGSCPAYSLIGVKTCKPN